jgi:hypothetical protein
LALVVIALSAAAAAVAGPDTQPLPEATAQPAPTATHPAPAATRSALPPPRPTLTPYPTPGPVSESAAKEGKQLLSRIVENLGGKAKIAKVHDMQTKGQVSTQDPTGQGVTMDILTAVVFPDHVAQQVDAPFGRLVMVATPAGAFLVGPQGTSDLPPELRDQLLRQILRVSLFLAQKAADPKLVVAPDGVEKIGEVEARILDLSYPGVRVRWFVDPKNGQILRSSHMEEGPDGRQMTVVSDFSDFRLVDGYSIPFHLDVNTNGNKEQTLLLETIKVNAGVDPRQFEKPIPPTPAATPVAPPLPKP